MQGCNIVDNTVFAFYTTACHDAGTVINAEGNWWGVADSASIEAMVYDFDDNTNCPTVVYIPFAESAFELNIPAGITPVFANNSRR